MLKKITLEGTVFTGEGNGKKYLALPWVKQQVEEKVGFTPFLGTLNLNLTRAETELRKLLQKQQSDAICPAEGYCVGLLFRAVISGVECAVIIPQVKGYPENVLEVVAPVNLRETLELKDGDAVTISVDV
jgi:riboflavin kinase, archaea type